MKLNILIGGKAGQGINKVSEIVSRILIDYGYFVFNYRDYPSLIRGGHNFNILSCSDQQIGSCESKLDGIIALDDKTLPLHQAQLKTDGFVISFSSPSSPFSFPGFGNLGRNLNLALAGALIKVLGLGKEELLKQIKKEFDTPEALAAAEQGFNSQKEKFELKKLKNRIKLMNGSQGIALGALNSGITHYLAYPMTPATGVMHELAARQKENNLIVFQPENEIAVVNAALGASFAGARVMIGTAGGGFDLMTEALSLQGQIEIPLVVYLATRPGPGTGIPTYSSQADLNVALHGGHGEFPRIVIAPGDPLECIEKTNEAFYLAEKFNSLSIILSDKHLAESEFSLAKEAKLPLTITSNREIPGRSQGIVRANSYEHDGEGNTTESAELTVKKADGRTAKEQEIKKECRKFEMLKIHGRKESKNLIVGWGSTKTVILDAIEGFDYKFMQVLYLNPLSEQVEEELKKAGKIILVEQNVTGQLGRLIREKTGMKIENRILRYDGRPFTSDELREEILKVK